MRAIALVDIDAACVHERASCIAAVGVEGDLRRDVPDRTDLESRGQPARVANRLAVVRAERQERRFEAGIPTQPRIEAQFACRLPFPSNAAGGAGEVATRLCIVLLLAEADAGIQRAGAGGDPPGREVQVAPLVLVFVEDTGRNLHALRILALGITNAGAQAQGTTYAIEQAGANRIGGVLLSRKRRSAVIERAVNILSFDRQDCFAAILRTREKLPCRFQIPFSHDRRVQILLRARARHAVPQGAGQAIQSRPIHSGIEVVAGVAERIQIAKLRPSHCRICEEALAAERLVDACQ